MFDFAFIEFISFIDYPYGEIRLSMRFMVSFSMESWPTPSKSLFMCFWMIDMLFEFARISTSSSFDMK